MSIKTNKSPTNKIFTHNLTAFYGQASDWAYSPAPVKNTQSN